MLSAADGLVHSIMPEVDIVALMCKIVYDSSR